MSLKRRHFLSKSIALGLSLPLFGARSFSLTPQKRPIIYLDESGTFPGEGLFAIGALYCSDTEHCLDQLRLLRKKHDYRSELKYRSRDRYKLPYAMDVIDFFFKEPSLSFSARFIQGSLDSTRVDYFEYLEFINQSNYEKLIEGTTASLRVQRPMMEKDEMAFFKKLSNSTEFHEVKDELAQMNDLLTGNIYGQHAQLSNPSKTALLEHLKKKLGTKNLLEVGNNPYNDKKFVVAQMVLK